MSGKRTTRSQAAAIVVRGKRICIVTTDGGRDWVIPKGNLAGGFRQTASMEAWEEAGVRGELSRRPLATFKYRKSGKQYRVKVYLLQASHVSRDWPESKSRRREWLRPKRALERLKYSSMRKAVQEALSRRAA